MNTGPYRSRNGQPTTLQRVLTLSPNWQRPFFTVWAGQALSLVGSALVRFALIWWLTEQTGSATTLTGATLSSLLPFFLLGPFVGALVDRWNRRWVMAKRTPRSTTSGRLLLTFASSYNIHYVCPTKSAQIPSGHLAQLAQQVTPYLRESRHKAR
jgi:MFS family permease